MKIETAPKDGTRIIIAVPDAGMTTHTIGEAYYNTTDPAGEDWWWSGNSHLNHFSNGIVESNNYHSPSHWLPLPAAPTPEAGR